MKTIRIKTTNKQTYQSLINLNISGQTSLPHNNWTMKIINNMNKNNQIIDYTKQKNTILLQKRENIMFNINYYPRQNNKKRIL